MRRKGIGGVRRRIDGNSGGIISSVLQTAEAVEEEFQNVAPLSVDVEIQIRENPAHNCRSVSGDV